MNKFCIILYLDKNCLMFKFLLRGGLGWFYDVKFYCFFVESLMLDSCVLVIWFIFINYDDFMKKIVWFNLNYFFLLVVSIL